MNTYTQNIIRSSDLRRPPDPRVFNGPFPQRTFNTPEPGMPFEQSKFYAPQILSNNPESQKKNSYLPYLIIFLVILIVVALALIYAFKDKIFKKGATLASAPSTEQSDAGYGTYGPPSLGLCKTGTGLCSDVGSQTVTQQCIPNPITNLGCLDKDGNQTFAPRVSNQNCNIPCRQFKFVETTRNPDLANNNPGTYDSVCKYYPAGQEGLPNYNDASLYPCLPTNEKIGQYYVKRNTCLPNDTNGTNECSVVCGNIDKKPNGFTTPPIEDPNSVLYIPICDPVLQKTLNYNKNLSSRHFYLNTFPWEIAFNLPQNGVVIGKGFTIKNLIDPTTGAIDLNNFSIDPPYVSPYDSNGNLITDESSLQVLTQITVQQLEDLDSNLYTYQTCEVENPRPFCGKYYLYNRTQYTPNIGVNETTLNTKPSLDPPINSIRTLSNGQYYSSRNCYFNDIFGSLTKFQSPYDYNYDPTSAGYNSSDYYSGGYYGYGIGLFGYTNDELNCLSSITIPSQESPDQEGAYNVPPSNGLCLSLNPLDNSSYPISPNDLIASNCFPLNDVSNLQYLPDNLPRDSDYPPSSGVLNTCNTQIAYEKAPTGTPGLLSICRYMPNNEDITISASDPLTGLPSYFKQLLGFYIRMIVTDSSTTPGSSYYLTLQNTPCDCSGSDVASCIPPTATNLNEPLGNCGGNPNNFGIGPIPTMLIYNGTTTDDLSGGTYWERPGCDSFLMNAVNSLQLIISPKNYDSINYRLECDIYCVFMGSYNGYLTYNYDNTSSPTYAELVYIPVKPGDIHPDDYYYDNGAINPSLSGGIDTKFAISLVSSSPDTYTIKAYNTNTSDFDLDVRVPTFNGTAPLNISTFFNLTSSGTLSIILYDKPDPTLPIVDPVLAFKDSNLIPFNPYYYKLLGGDKYIESPLSIMESGGLYPDENLYNTVLSQQTSTCNVGTQTCNLFCSY